MSISAIRRSRPTFFFALFAASRVALAAAPSLSVLSVSPASLSAPGGTVSVSVTAQSAAGIQAVQATVARPDGARDVVSLARTGGTAANGAWGGTYTLPRNFTASPLAYHVIFSASDTTGASAQSPPLDVIVAAPGPLAPALTLTSVPPFGSYAALQGRALNVAPQDYNVAIQIFVEGLGFYSKPYCTPLFTGLQGDNSWAASITTGGTDPTATLIVAYLVPASFTSSCRLSGDGLPPDLEAAAVARVIATRTDPNLRIVHFAGRDWWVKSNTVPLGPGPTYFSDSASNVFTDAQGRLHLAVTNVSGTWSGAEVVSQNFTGNGTYRFYLDSPVFGIDPNIVLGFFTWSPTPLYYHRELDAEQSRFGNAADTNNSQFVVQSYTQPGNQTRFFVPSGATPSAYEFQWYPTAITFQAASGPTPDPTDPSLILRKVVNTQTVPPPGPDVHVRLNAWLFNGAAPSSGQPAEFIVRDFQYTPLTVTADSVGPSSGTGGGVTLQAVFTDSAAAADFSGAWVSFAPAGTPQAGGSCVAFYSPAGGQLYLWNDTGDGWLGPAAVGVPDTLSNQQCSLNPQNTTAVLSSTHLTLTLPVTFTAAFPGAHTVALRGDGVTVSSGWNALGSWSVPAPALSVTVTANGAIRQGQTGATYTVSVANQAAGAATYGPVTVAESLPAALSLVSMSGTGWTCGGNHCGRSDPLAAGVSYPDILVTVNVAALAPSPLTNSVTVSGGGAPTITSIATTVVNPNLPSLLVTLSHTGNFSQGQQNAVYTVTVSNQAGAGTTTAPVVLTEYLPAGLITVSMTGAGWTCLGNACTQGAILAGGASYPPIFVTVNVAANAPSPLTNFVVATGGSASPPVVCLAFGCPGTAQDVTLVNPVGPLHLSSSSLGFGTANLGTSSTAASVTVTNTGNSSAHVTSIVTAGSFYADYAVTHNCATLQPLAACQVNVGFTPGGAGPRPATLFVVSDTANSPQAVSLNGTGVGTCTTVSDCGYDLLNRRVNENRLSFFVYRDKDSGFNHGFPSGLFGNIDLTQAVLDAGCVDDPVSATGCSTDPARLDAVRNTVFRFVFPRLLASQFAGVNFRDPDNYDAHVAAEPGYNLSPATLVQLEARSPGGAVAQFGVGGCVTGSYALTPQWQTIVFQIADLLPPKGDAQTVCPPDVTNTHILFTIATSSDLTPNAGTILVDNVQYLPVPLRQTTDSKSLSLPLGTQSFATPPQSTTPPDVANRNLAPIYEAAATVLALLSRGQPGDVSSATRVVDTLDYALHHENSGDPLPAAPDGSVALHSAYSGGDIALQTSQAAAGGAHAGEVRLAGFMADTSLCPPTGFCLVLDGATGGNNAWAKLAFVAAYSRTGDIRYLNDAETVGNWIAGKLMDTGGFKGYFVGIADAGSGPAGSVIQGKSTENNGDLFAAFSLLAAIEKNRGNLAASTLWTTRANWAGDFVMQMFDGANGRFYTGTVDAASQTAPGNCRDVTIIVGNDRINTCDFLDSNTFTLLPMALATRYQQIDWTRPLQYSLTHFAQTVTAAGITWNGFDLVPSPTANNNGVAWEFTGQMVESIRYFGSSALQSTGDAYMTQIQTAQRRAPFGDGLGLPAATLQDGDTLPPALQCLSTPFQCIPERVGLAATNWAIYAERKINPLGFGSLIATPSAIAPFAGQLIGTSSAGVTITLLNIGVTPVNVSSVGTGSGEFPTTNTCATIAPGATCSIQVVFTPSGPDLRSATLQIVGDAVPSLLAIPLSGTGLPANDFGVIVAPSPASVVAGRSATLNVSLPITRGAAQQVSLSMTCGGLGVVGGGIFQSGGAAVPFTVATTASTVPKAYACVATGAGPSGTRSGSATLNVASSVALSPASIDFGAVPIGASGTAAAVSLTNLGPSPLAISISLTGSFPGDFAQTNSCVSPLAAGGICSIAVGFSPKGTGPRSARLAVVDAAGDSPQAVLLTGTGVGNCTSAVDCSYQLLNSRASAGATGFAVYLNADSGLNHGYPSGIFGSTAAFINAVSIDSACIDSPGSANGCTTDSTALDGSRGTVTRISLPWVQLGGDYGGVNFEDPQNYAPAPAPPGYNTGAGYNLTGATSVSVDVRSPDGAVVQLGVGPCHTGPLTIGPTWTTVQISLTVPGALTCPPTPPFDLTNVHILFSVATTSLALNSGGTLLLDNIVYKPVPARQTTDPTAAGLPVSTQTFGVVAANHLPIPPDQVNRGLASTREAALTVIALLNRGQSADVTNAIRIAGALHYALYHDNHGVPLPTAPGTATGCFAGAAATSCGLHSAYFDGDIAFLNQQPPPELGQAGDVRLAGFSSGTGLCGPSGFCLVLDGASGGNNALAILAFLAAYRQSGDSTYLNDALTVANWIVANLADTSASPYGGYFAGYSDGGVPKSRLTGKSTADNALLYLAFGSLSGVLSGLGRTAEAAQWTSSANSAGDFVSKMFVASTGQVVSGTSPVQGADTLNTAESLDANALAIVALADQARYTQVDLKKAIQYALAGFGRSVAAGGVSFNGLQLTAPLPGTLAGVAWESVGQMVTAMKLVDSQSFATQIAAFIAEMRKAQNQAPFGDGLGLPAATVQGGDTLPPTSQCLSTPYACLPERVGIAATAWQSFAENGGHPFLAPASLSITKTHDGNFTQGQQNSTYTVTVSNAANAGPTSGTVTMTETVPSGLTLVSMAGTGWTCPSGGTTCTRSSALAGGASYPAITVTVNVAANAGTPLSNSVSVSGGGSANNSYTDVTNIAAVAASITATQGAGQSTQVNAAFATALQATVKDAGGNPVPSVTVTFTAPSSGASGTFAGGGTTATTTTNASGVATAPTLTANSTAGGYSVTARAAGVSTPTTFGLTNTPGAPVLSISKSHTGNFTQGQNGATYSVTVGNGVGAGPTSGTVTVTETVPSGMTLVSMAGTGWTCPNGGSTCTRSDALAAGVSHPAITVTVNVAANATSPQVNTVSVSGNGSVTANATDSTVIAAAAPQAFRLVPITPCRILDTRNATGPFGGPIISGGSSRDFAVPSSACSIPATAQAYSLNVAVVPTTTLGYLTLWPAGQTRPLASTLNSLDGRIKSNAAIVPAGTGGAVSVFASDTTHVILDINGYFVPASNPTGLAFYPITPCRIGDTRTATAPLGGPALVGGQSRTLPILASTCNLPATAQAYSLNFAAVPNGSLGYLTAWPTGHARPLAASLNALTGAITANAAIVPAGTNGSIDVFASNTTNLVIDINGYFAPMGTGGVSLYGVTPCRVEDTRLPAGSAPITTLDVAVSASACGIPASAQADVMSVTVVPQGSPAYLGYLTLWPQGQARPVVSTLNALDGAITSNLAIVPTSNGSISAFASNATHLIIDIFGYFAP
jgi:uncharacterized repeat protein (TIGR01451 family)